MGGTAVSKPKPREFRPQEVTYTSTFTIVYSTDAAGRNTYRLATPAAPMAKGEAVAVTIDRNPDAAGWDFIRFTADKALLSRDQAEAYYAAGYAEGLLTADSIYSSFVTAMSQDGDPHFDERLDTVVAQKWIDTHLKFMRDLSSKNTTRYGVMVKSLLRQIDGMHAGYNVAVQNLTGDDAPEPMSWLEMFYLSFQSEMNHAVNGANAIYDEDELLQQLEENTTYINKTRSTNSSNGTAFSQLRGSAHSSQHRRFTPVSHCSALLRVTGNDIFIGHDTWSSFNTMVRQYKTYALAGTVTMSGYPGSLSSVDDWFMTGAKLAVTETSIILETDTLDDEIRPESVSEFVRVMVANYLATSAKEWVDLFSGHNSGTYNNQYLILDTNKAAKRLTNTTGVFQRFDPDTFWVLEQTVGLIVARDQTNLLNDQRYFASYDLPYFIEVFNRSGFQDDASFAESHAVDPRARLFRRMSPNITDLGGMYTIMRYNNYEKDDESLIQICIDGSFRCWNNRSAMQSIAARGDLAPPDFDFPGDALEYLNELGRINYGAIDTKITSVRMMQEENNAGIAVNGPTSESVPPFNTTKFILENGENSNDDILDGVEWRGVPRFFNFPPVKLVHVVKPGDSKAAALKHVADSIVTSRRRTKRGRKDRSVERHRGGPLDSSHHLEFATDAGLVAPMRDDDPLQGDTRSGRIGASSAVGFVVAVCACVAVFATIRRRSRQRQPLSAPGEGYVGLL